MALSKRAAGVSEKEQTILNGIQALEHPLIKNKQEKKELVDRIQFLTKSLGILRVAVERYEENPDLADPQRKRIEKFELELKERNERMEEVNLIIKNIEQRIFQLKESLDEAIKQKTQIAKKPKKEVTEVIPKKETIETEEIEVKETEISETEKSFAAAAEWQAVIEKELNFSALQQAKEQAFIEYKLAKNRLEECLDGFSDEDINQEEEEDEEENEYYEEEGYEEEGYEEEGYEEVGANVGCLKLKQELKEAEIKLNKAEEQLVNANAIIEQQSQVQRIKTKFTKENTKLQQIRTDINYMQEELDSMDSYEEAEKFIALQIERISKCYKIINAVFKLKTSYYEEKEEKEKGLDQIVDRDKYDRTRQDTLLLMYQLNEIVPQQRLIDQLMSWRKAMIKEVAPEKDQLYRKLMAFLTNFERLGIHLTKFIEKLRKRERKIGRDIESNDFLLWEKIKKEPIKLDTRGAIVVDTVMQFITQFDKRFGRKTYKRFYFSDKFMSDSLNVKKAIYYLLLYYQDQPIPNIEEIFRVPPGTAASLLGISKKKWKTIKKSINPVAGLSNARIIEKLQKRKKSYYDKLVKIYESAQEEDPKTYPGEYVDELAELLEEKNPNLYNILVGGAVVKEDNSIVTKIAKKFGISEVDLLGVSEKGAGLTPILERIFAYDPDIAANIDPDDPYYYFVNNEAKTEEDTRQRKRLIFRGIDSSLDGYIRSSLRYAAIKMAKPEGGLGRSINCPLYNCDGKIYFELPDPGDKTFRSALHDWSYGSGSVMENKGFSKCDKCGWAFANQFINCPNCNLAVPISSTIDSWFKLQPDTWLGKDSLIIGGEKVLKETAIAQLVESIKPSVDQSIKLHNKNRYRKVKEFRAALQDHIEILKDVKDEEKYKKAIEISRIIDFMGIKESDPAIMIQEFFSEDTSHAALHQEFSRIWALFTNRRLGVRTASNLHRISKRTMPIIKKMAEEMNVITAPVERSDTKYPGLSYGQIDKLSARFTENVQLICPHCLYGHPDKGEEFNPSKLAMNKLTLTSSLEPMFYNLDAFGMGDKEIILGNTPDATVGEELPKTSAEVPSVKVRIEQQGNALFLITNLSASDIKTSNRRLYKGQSTNLGPGGSFTLLNNFTYRIDGGTFIVHPKMAISSSEIILSGNTKDTEEQFKDRLREEAFGRSTIEDLDKKDQEAINNLIDNDVHLIIQAFYMLADSNPNLEEVGQYMMSLGLDSKEVSKVYEIAAYTLKKIVENPKRPQIEIYILEKLTRDLVIGMELVAPGIKEYNKNVDIYVNAIKGIVKNLQSTKRAEERIEGYDIEEVSEKRQELEEGTLARLKMVSAIPKGAIRQSAPLRAYLTKIERLFVKTNENVDLTKRLNFMDSFVPNVEEPILKEGDFFDKHLIQDNASLIALIALRKRFLDIPEQVVEESTISMDPLSVREQKIVKYKPSNLPQIIKNLESIFVMQDAEDAPGEASSLAQILCEEASIIFMDQMKSNPQLFKTKLLDNTTGKLKDLSRFDSFEIGARIADVRNKNYFVTRPMTDGYITNIETIIKDDKDIYVDNKNKIFVKGGNIYIHKSIPMNINDRLIVKGHYVSKTFYEKSVKPIVGQLSADIFGANFNYSIHSPKIAKEYNIHPIIYKTGLDKELQSFEDLKNSEDEDKISKMRKAAFRIKMSKKAYSKVITSLREVVERKAEDWKLSKKDIETSRFDYRLAVGRIPPEKESMFWKNLTQYIVEYPNNQEPELRYDARETKLTGVHSFRENQKALPANIMKISIEDLMFEVFGVRVKTAPEKRN